MPSVEKYILKIQRRLSSEEIEERKILKYIKCLEQLEITVDVLKSTGIGKTINGLKKLEGPIGEAANGLIKRWKEIVSGKGENGSALPGMPLLSQSGKTSLLNSKASVSSRDEEKEHSSNKHGRHKKEKHEKHRERDKQKNIHVEPKSKVPSLQLCDVSFGCEIPLEPVKQKKKYPHSSSSALTENYNYDLNSSGSISLPPLPSVSSVSEALLPEIQPSYRPSRPLDYDSSPVKKNKGTISGSSKIDSALMSKKSRTQVFSGRRTAAMCGIVTPLFDLCMKVLIENIEALHDTGGVPYDILAPVLTKCSPQQLLHLEDCNPYFIEDTDDLWQLHCRREFKCDKPEDDLPWRDSYIKKLQEREERLEKINAKIAAAQAAKKPERQVKLAYVMTEAKPPPQVRRKQARYGTGCTGDIPLISPSPRRNRSADHTSSHIKKSESHTSNHNTSSFSDNSTPNNSTPTKKRSAVAPMMKKTMKLLKNQRNRAGAQIKRR